MEMGKRVFSSKFPELFRELDNYIERFRGKELFLVGSMPEVCGGFIRQTPQSRHLSEALKGKDISFSQLLLRTIEEKGMSQADCYKKALVDRKLFSKILSNLQYRPSKETVLAFCVALELDLDETEKLLKAAGYVLSNSRDFDIIVRFFIEKGLFNIMEINEALLEYDQPLLSCR